jgi:dipeptide transport system ATP-binding protein
LAAGQRIVLQGELPSPLNPPTGCVFNTRCAYATDRCRAERPVLRALDERLVACHHAERFIDGAAGVAPHNPQHVPA